MYSLNADTSEFISTISYTLEKILSTLASLWLEILLLSSLFLSIGETIATFAASGNIPFIRLLLIACDSGTESVSEAAFTSVDGIVSSSEAFLMSRDFS